MLLQQPTPAQMLLLCFAVFTCFGVAHCKARFLSHIPFDDEERELSENNENDLSYDDIHDSITKLRGRHYPKLSYTPIAGTHHLSHRFNRYSQITSIDPRFGLTSQSLEITELDGPRMLPLETPPLGDSLGHSKLGQHGKSPTNRYPKARISDHFGEYSPGYLHNSPPYRQNDEEHRQSSESSKSTANESEESALLEEDLGPSPRFARSMKRNVTARSGDTAELVCQVVNLLEQSVSWIRPNSLNILTVDTFRYSTDKRLSVQHRRLHHQEWVLRIRNVTELDSGLYECQISTAPLLSYVVNLFVSASDAPTDADSARGFPDTAALTRTGMEEPWAEFSGGTALFLQRGSPINLECLVTHQSIRPVLVNWYHLDQILYPSVESSTEERTHKQLSSPPHQILYPSVESSTEERTHKQLSSPPLLSHNPSKVNKVSESPHPSVDLFSIDNSAATRAEENSIELLEDRSAQYHRQQYLQQQHAQQQQNQEQLNHIKTVSESLHSDEGGFPDYPTDDTKSYGLVVNNREVRADAPDKPLEAQIRTRFSLLVGLATDGRAGRYTCSPVGGKNASVVVHVITGSDHTPQLLTGSSPRPTTSLLSTVLTLASALWWLSVLT